MNCICCMKPLLEGVSCCPGCGFPLLFSLGKEPMPEEERRRLIINYRAARLSGTRLSLAIYHYKDSGSGIVPDGEELIPLADSAQLCTADPYWLDTDFARVPGRKELHLSYVLEKNGERKTGSVSVPCPPGQDYWRVGLDPNEGKDFSILVRCGGECRRSEDVALI